MQEGRYQDAHAVLLKIHENPPNEADERDLARMLEEISEKAGETVGTEPIPVTHSTWREPQSAGLNPVSAPASEEVDITLLGSAPFIRGDSNGDGIVDVGDAVKIVFHLLSGSELACGDAADIDDDETLEFGDVLGLLDHLFSSGSTPADPYPGAGLDPAGAALGCSD